ncbi:MAG: C4-type zinc ribbon domain-containing protein [Candidatus Omnitrophota bacterium]
MSTADNIKSLIELQKLDSEIFKLQGELDSHPVLIRGLEDTFRQKESDYKQKEEETKSFLVKRKEKENELAAKEGEIQKLQSQLFQLKTNKEYQAMEKEISSKKADVSVIEEEIIKILDQIDEANKKLIEYKAVLSEHKAKFDSEKSRVDQRSKEIERQLAALKSDRGAKAQGVDKVFLAKYERILNSKDGLALVPVLIDACGGCNMNLPPQVINEIKLKERLISCESCARLLYIDENEG